MSKRRSFPIFNSFLVISKGNDSEGDEITFKDFSLSSKLFGEMSRSLICAVLKIPENETVDCSLSFSGSSPL